LILSIETTTKACSVALHNKGVLLAESTLYVDRSHSEKLAILIKNLLSCAEVTTKELTAVAIAGGPGSYTGLRIGTSTAKGLCYALSLPLIAINTLEAMAVEVVKYVSEKVLLCSMLDARRMEVYSLLMDGSMNTIKPTEAKLIDENSFSEELKKQKILFFGNGSSKCKPLLGNNKNAIFLDIQAISAVHVGELAWAKFQEEIFENLAYYEPKYLKEFIAIKPKNLFA